MNLTKPHQGSLALYALCGLALTLMLAARADAQLIVQMKLNKKDFVSYEPVKATVTVHNRAGQDVVMGGPGGSSWLSFDVTMGGRMLSPRPRRNTGLTPFLLGAGKSVTKTVDVGSVFPMTHYGTYTIKASIYFPPTRTEFTSAKQRINVSEPRAFWKQSIGVAQGAGQLASFREYSLMEHRSQTRSDLYVRLRGTKGGRVYCTYSIGTYIDIRKPQATVDSQNRLHVLHMTGPRIYQHSTVSPDGGFVGAELFSEGPRDRPKLMIDPGGVVQVRGGKKHDPDAEAIPTSTEPKTHYASDRPPGLPR